MISSFGSEGVLPITFAASYIPARGKIVELFSSLFVTLL